MRMWIPLFVVLSGIGAVLGSVDPKDEKPVWHSDWPTAQRIALKSNKPVFAVLVCKH